MNYFALLSLPAHFDLDPAALEAAYFAAQRQYHPDRFVNKPPEERVRAASMSADLNEAYNALKHPLTRAKHLLALSGVTVLDEANSAKPDTTLLMEIMELQERLENGRTPQLQAEIATRAKACEGVLADAFKNNALEAAKTSTIRLSYYYKLLH